MFKISTNGALTTLYSFTGTNDGEGPEAGLVQGSDGYFYGTTYGGGTNGGYGTVFKINTNGVLTTLYSFPCANDGAYPQAGLVQGSDGNFYGTTSGRGPSGDGYGTVFKINTNGALTNLASFDSNNGANPDAGLVQGSDGNFYGTTYYGGTNGGYGTVFKISTNGVLTSLYSFPVFAGGYGGANPSAGLVQGNDGYFYGTTSLSVSFNGPPCCPLNGIVFKVSTNGVLTSLYSFTGGNDGLEPFAGLVQGSDGSFYGTTYFGGTNGGYGTVFQMDKNGALTSLYSFTGGNDGAYPEAGLVQGSDGNFYGTTSAGGTYVFGYKGYGTVFKISTNGVLTSLYSFTGGNDGGEPLAGLVQGSDGNFYGTTKNGGTNGGYGTVFQMDTNGALTTLYSFTGGNDGAYPEAGLVQGGDGNFYGTTYGGGTNGNGTVFRLTVVPPPPQLTIIHSGSNVILTWPTDYNAFSYAGNTLQSTTDLGPLALWTTNSSAPVVVNGQNTVTNLISGRQQFYRLSQ